MDSQGYPPFSYKFKQRAKPAQDLGEVIHRGSGFSQLYKGYEMPDNTAHDRLDDYDFGFKTIQFEIYKAPDPWNPKFYVIRTRILWSRFVNRWLFPWRRKQYDGELESALHFGYAGRIKHKRVSALIKVKPSKE